MRVNFTTFRKICYIFVLCINQSLLHINLFIAYIQNGVYKCNLITTINFQRLIIIPIRLSDIYLLHLGWPCDTCPLNNRSLVINSNTLNICGDIWVVIIIIRVLTRYEQAYSGGSRSWVVVKHFYCWPGTAPRGWTVLLNLPLLFLWIRFNFLSDMSWMVIEVRWDWQWRSLIIR